MILTYLLRSQRSDCLFSCFVDNLTNIQGNIIKFAFCFTTTRPEVCKEVNDFDLTFKVTEVNLCFSIGGYVYSISPYTEAGVIVFVVKYHLVKDNYIHVGPYCYCERLVGIDQTGYVFPPLSQPPNIVIFQCLDILKDLSSLSLSFVIKLIIIIHHRHHY